MRYLNVVIAILFFGPNINLIHSQEYTPFHLDNIKWTMKRTTPVLGAGDGQAYWEIYTLNDTLINDTLYRKVATRNLCEQWPDLNGNLHYNNSIRTEEFILGGIREENKKVYFIRFHAPPWYLLQYNWPAFSLGSEHLLYDFDFLIGDTIYFTNNYFTIIVDSLPPVQNHNVFEVINSGTGSFPWETGKLIEGVGSSYGFFGAYDSYYTQLLCYSINGVVTFYGINWTPCAGFVSTDDVDDMDKLLIYPNPSNGSLNIESEPNNIIKEIKIIDSLGRLLSVNKYASSIIQLDFPDMYSGIVFLNIKFDNGMESIKKVVVR